MSKLFKHYLYIVGYILSPKTLPPKQIRSLNTMQFLKFNFKMEGTRHPLLNTKEEKKQGRPSQNEPCLCECGNWSIFVAIASELLGWPLWRPLNGRQKYLHPSSRWEWGGGNRTERRQESRLVHPWINRFCDPSLSPLQVLEQHLITPIIRFIAW